MASAFYELLDESTDATEATTRVRSTRHTTGPWDARLQHAGPPAALLTRTVRRLAELPDGGLPARLCFDILSPVPVADLVARARVLRPGRRIGLAEASLAPASDPERPVMTLRAWILRQRDASAVPSVPDVPGTPAPEGQDAAVMPRPAGWQPGYLDAIEWRWAHGRFEEPGPATVWARVLVPLVDGEELDPVERLAVLADSASGISAVANPLDMLFVNTDLTMHLTRPPRGESIWMSAATSVDRNGIGRTRGQLGDTDGSVAQTGQTLFVEPRTGR